MSSWVKVVALYFAGAVTLPLIVVIAYLTVLDSYRDSEWRLRDVSYSPDGRYKVRVESSSNAVRIVIQDRDAISLKHPMSERYIGSYNGNEYSNCYPMISVYWRSPLEFAVYGGQDNGRPSEWSEAVQVGSQTLNMVRHQVSARREACVHIASVSPLEKWLARQ
jgi:hypothetical protein